MHMVKLKRCTWKINSNYPQDSLRLVTLHARRIWIPRVHEVKENTLVIELLHIVNCDCLLFISQSLKHSRHHFSPLPTDMDLFLGKSLIPSSLIALPFPSPPFTSLHFFHFTSLYYTLLLFILGNPFKLFTSLLTFRFTMLCFSSLFDDFQHSLTSFQFNSIITFLTLFLKVIGLQGRVPNTSAGVWFQCWMVRFNDNGNEFCERNSSSTYLQANLFLRVSRIHTGEVEGFVFLG